MRRLSFWKSLLAAGSLAIGLGAAPAAPSYHGVERAIDAIRAAWNQPGAAAQPNAAGWNAFFDALRGELRNCANASSENDRLTALNRLYRMWVALETTPWRSGTSLRDELRTWLRPRVRLAWAERRMLDSVRGTSTTVSPEAQQNRERWLRFVDSDLGRALRQYDGAPTVAQRQEALHRVYGALNALRQTNEAHPWVPAVTLQNALNDLYNRSNLDITADAPTLEPVLGADVVETGPVYFKGYLSQVTAGPKTGFGLLPSDCGIAFYNSQMMQSATPIWDFQNQLQADRRGRLPARLYQFNATSFDWAELTILAELSSHGLELGPCYLHNIDALIGSAPQAKGHVARTALSAVGLNQSRITGLVYKNAIPKIRENVVQSAGELGSIKTNEEAAKRNVEYSQYLIGNDRLAYRNLLIEGLSLRSRPEHALVGGTLHWRNASDQVGADAPQPSQFARPESGVTADLHLSSIMTNLTRGYLQSDAVKDVHNLMLITHKVPPNAPPGQGIEVVRNADYASFLKAVAAAEAANDPKVLAVRVKRPGQSPEFSADARGYLVALVHDFQIEVPAPANAARGGLFGRPAKVYRITSPQAEVVISFKVTAKTEKEPIRLAGRIEEFDLGPGARVYGINEDENAPAALNAFTSNFVLGILRSKVQGQPIDIPLSNLQLRGFDIREVSRLDPTGWIRAELVRTSSSPAAGLR